MLYVTIVDINVGRYNKGIITLDKGSKKKSTGGSNSVILCPIVVRLPLTASCGG